MLTAITAAVVAADLLACAAWVLRQKGRPLEEFDLDRRVRWWLWHLVSGSEWVLAEPLYDEKTLQKVAEPAWRFWARSWPFLHIGRAPPNGWATRWRRGLCRTAVAAGACAAAGFLLGAARWQLWAFAPAVLALGVWLEAEATVRGAVYLWHKHPLHKKVFRAAGWAEGRKATRGPWRYIRLRVRYGRVQAAKIKVCPDFDQSDASKARVVRQVAGGLRISEPADTWDFGGIRHHVWIREQPRLPHEAFYSEQLVYDGCEKVRSGASILVGLGRDSELMSHNFDQDAPHALLSASTIGGKSATLRWWAAQLYCEGAYLVICDLKMSSHVGWTTDPATGLMLPGMVYADTPDEIAQAFTAVGHIAEARNAKAKAALRRGVTPHFERLVIVLDEANGTMAELRRHHHEEAIHWYRRTLWMGRVVAINMLCAGQRMDADAAGGGAARECFGFRQLAEFSDQTARIVAPQADLPPCVPHKDQPGWSVVVYGRDAAECQRVYATEAEAKALVLRRTAPVKHDLTLGSLLELAPPRALPAGERYDERGDGPDDSQDPASLHRWNAEAEEDRQPGRQLAATGAGTTPTVRADSDGGCHSSDSTPAGARETDLILPTSWGSGAAGAPPLASAAGIPAPTSDYVQSPSGPHEVEGVKSASSGLSSSGEVYTSPDREEWVTLREMVERRILPATNLHQMRLAAGRQGFPKGRKRIGSNALEYPRSQVVEWWYVGRKRAPANREDFDPGIYWFVLGSGAEDAAGWRHDPPFLNPEVDRRGVPRRGCRYDDTVKVGKTENIAARVSDYAGDLLDVVKWERCGDENDDPYARLELMNRREEEWHGIYDAENLRLYPRKEQFAARGRLARDLGVLIPEEALR